MSAWMCGTESDARSLNLIFSGTYSDRVNLLGRTPRNLWKTPDFISYLAISHDLSQPIYCTVRDARALLDRTQYVSDSRLFRPSWKYCVRNTRTYLRWYISEFLEPESEDARMNRSVDRCKFYFARISERDPLSSCDSHLDGSGIPQEKIRHNLEKYLPIHES